MKKYLETHWGNPTKTLESFQSRKAGTLISFAVTLLTLHLQDSFRSQSIW